MAWHWRCGVTAATDVVPGERRTPPGRAAEIRISPARAGEMLEDFADLSVMRYPMLPYQRRALALRDNFTAYDAFYAALAEALRAPLLTDDRKYDRAAGHTAIIETYS